MVVGRIVSLYRVRPISEKSMMATKGKSKKMCCVLPLATSWTRRGSIEQNVQAREQE